MLNKSILHLSGIYEIILCCLSLSYSWMSIRPVSLENCTSLQRSSSERYLYKDRTKRNTDSPLRGSLRMRPHRLKCLRHHQWRTVCLGPTCVSFLSLYKTSIINDSFEFAKLHKERNYHEIFAIFGIWRKKF